MLPQSYYRYSIMSLLHDIVVIVHFSNISTFSMHHRFLAVCFMPITCLCGCASHSFVASVCSCSICVPWSFASLTLYCQVNLPSPAWGIMFINSDFILFFFVCSSQEFWFFYWVFLPFSTAGSTLLLRCFALQTGCFTRYCHHSL